MGERLFANRRNHVLTVLLLALWYVLAKRLAFPEFQKTSDILVDTAYRMVREGRPLNGWPSLRFPDETVYYSQFGLQGILYTIPARLGIPEAAGIGFARLFSGVLFAGVMVAFAGAIARLFGRRAGQVLVGLLAFAPWLVLMADSPYWATGLLFLPFVLTWSRFEDDAAHGRWARFYGLLFGAVLLKCLCGYEYLTNITLAPLVPILFFAMRDRWKPGKAVLVGAAAFGAGCLAFVVALGMHIALLSGPEGSPRKATTLIKERASSRSGRGKDVSGDGGIFVPDDARTSDLVKAYFGGGRPRVRMDTSQITPDKAELYTTDKPNKIAKVMGLTNLGLFLATILTLGLAWRRSVGEDGRSMRLFAIATVAALPVSVTWLVFAFRHAYIHWHLDHIVFYLPLYAMAMALLAIVLGRPRQSAPNR